MSYKYNPIPEGLDVLFLEVIKPVHWHNRPEDHDNYYVKIPVGSITWTRKVSCIYKIVDNLPVLIDDSNAIYAITPENNRYCANYDPSCFRILHTSTQKIRR